MTRGRDQRDRHERLTEPEARDFLARHAGLERGCAFGWRRTCAQGARHLELTPHTLFKAQFAWTFVYTAEFEEMSQDIPYLFIRVVNTF